jgi:radical SAM superfamily enzyme YgiQ (UPF0313 family)
MSPMDCKSYNIKEHDDISSKKMEVSVCLIYWEGYNKPVSYTRQLYPALGTMYVAAALRNSIRKVSIIDAPASGYTTQDILTYLKTEKPNYTGFTIYVNQVNSSMKIAKIIKGILPNTKIIFGGPHIYFHYEQIMRDCKDVDYCIRGEGEYSLLSLIESNYHNKALEGIPGLTYRKNGQVCSDLPPEIIENLDGITFPARELTPYKNYRSTESLGRKKNFTTILASRGCPHDCPYCDSAARWKKRVYFRTPENVIQELIELQTIFKMKYVRFVDDYFTLKKDWVKRFCELYKEKNIKIKWQCSARIESIDSEIVQQMKMAGCKIIALGIEFGNENIRKLVRKNFSNVLIRRAVRIIKDAGIETYGLFMIGYPMETESTIKETIEMAVTLDLDMAGFSIVTPYPGTEFYRYCMNNKLLKTDNLESYGTQKEPVFTHEKLSSEQLLYWQKYAKKRFFMRPKFFIKRLKKANLYDFYLLFRFLNSLLKQT